MVSSTTEHKDAGSTANNQSRLVVVDIPGESDPAVIEAERVRHEPRETLIWLVESESDIFDLIVRNGLIDARTDDGRVVVEDALTGDSDQSEDAREDAHAAEKPVMSDGGDR